jgi:hypothetical protein
VNRWPGRSGSGDLADKQLALSSHAEFLRPQSIIFATGFRDRIKAAPDHLIYLRQPEAMRRTKEEIKKKG